MVRTEKRAHEPLPGEKGFCKLQWLPGNDLQGILEMQNAACSQMTGLLFLPRRIRRTHKAMARWLGLNCCCRSN